MCNYDTPPTPTPVPDSHLDISKEKLAQLRAEIQQAKQTWQGNKMLTSNILLPSNQVKTKENHVKTSKSFASLDGPDEENTECPLGEVSFRTVVAMSPQSLVSVVGWGRGSNPKAPENNTVCKVTTGLLWRGFSTVAPLPHRRFYVICSVQFHEQQEGVCTWRRRGVEVGGGAGWSMVDAPRSLIKSIPRSEKENGRSVTPIRCPWSCEPARWWTFPLCTSDCSQTRVPGAETHEEEQKLQLQHIQIYFNHRNTFNVCDKDLSQLKAERWELDQSSQTPAALF